MKAYYDARAREYDECYKRYFGAEDLLAELGGGRTLHTGRHFVAVAS